MTYVVSMHIRTCPRYVRFKQPQKRAEMKPIFAIHFLEKVHLDFLVIGSKQDEDVNISVITDHFTKYAQAHITSTQTAAIVARTLWKKFLVHYGWSEKLLTDQGKSFESRLVSELCDLAQLQKLRASPCRP